MWIQIPGSNALKIMLEPPAFQSLGAGGALWASGYHPCSFTARWEPVGLNSSHIVIQVKGGRKSQIQGLSDSRTHCLLGGLLTDENFSCEACGLILSSL